MTQKRIVIAVLMCAASSCLMSAAEECTAGSCLKPAAEKDVARPVSNPVLVEVDGKKLTLADLETKHAAALFQARTTYYDTEQKVIQEFVDEYLLQQEASKEGLTVDQLLKKHVDETLPKDPSEESLHVYYEGVDTNEPYEAVRGKIIDAIRQRRLAKLKTAYLQSLRSEASIVLRLAPPRTQLSMVDVPVRGAANAAVTLLEFADYECPYCQQAQPLVAKIEAEFKGKIAFAYKDYPLPMHPHAEKAAEAAHCAAAQGEFWEYHDRLFADKQLEVPDLKKEARELHLDGKAFDSCLDSGEMAKAVKTQANEAEAIGVSGTPTFLVNGRAITGDITYEKLRAILNEELSNAEASAAGRQTTASAASTPRRRLADASKVR